MDEVKEINNLLDGIGRTGLLPIPKRRVRNPYFIGHVHRIQTVVKRYLGDFIVRKDVPEEVWFRRIVQLKDVFFWFHGVAAFAKSEQFHILLHNYSHYTSSNSNKI